jgi:hypothetical protein
MDEPSDLLYRLIVHELTHVFQFDIIPTSLIRSNMPLWVMEGMADYLTGIWRPIDLMTVRDAAVADIVPKMTELQEYGNFGNMRMIYNLGHAAFEFIESRWGKEGVRQFIFSLRKSVIGGGDNAFEEAFQMEPDEWDQPSRSATRSARRTTAATSRPIRCARSTRTCCRSSRHRPAISSPR